MLALAGIAEVALPEALLPEVLGTADSRAWQSAGLVAVESFLALPPHRCVCLGWLSDLGADAPAVGEALSRLVGLSKQASPFLGPRLLCGLARTELTRGLALREAEKRRAEVEQADGEEAVKRMWWRVYDDLGLSNEATANVRRDPPGMSSLAAALLNQGAYDQALSLYGRLARDPVYRAEAQFNCTLALALKGLLAEAEAELERLAEGPPGMLLLRGLLAEKRGDYVVALDAYQAARKADVLALTATRRLACAYLRSGAPRAAIPLFEAALCYTPLAADLYGGLAVAHLHTGQAQRAAAQSPEGGRQGLRRGPRLRSSGGRAGGLCGLRPG
jgi:tetratricopeptide (TPR) repeat protein